jgi:hypothetical protein
MRGEGVDLDVALLTNRTHDILIVRALPNLLPHGWSRCSRQEGETDREGGSIRMVEMCWLLKASAEKRKGLISSITSSCEYLSCE